MIHSLICSVLLCQPAATTPPPTSQDILAQAQRVLKQINPNAKLPESVVVSMTSGQAMPAPVSPPSPAMYLRADSNTVRTLQP